MRGNRSTGIEHHSVQDAADVVLHGSLRDEQPSGDLLVGLSVGDQLGDLQLSLCERCWCEVVPSVDGNACRLAESQSQGGAPRQALSRIELGVEPAATER